MEYGMLEILRDNEVIYTVMCVKEVKIIGDKLLVITDTRKVIIPMNNGEMYSVSESVFINTGERRYTNGRKRTY